MNNNTKNLTFSSLDPSQKNTYDSIVNGDDNLHVVYGPPGTGKSQLVVSLLEGLASHGNKILFVSQNTEALRVIERMIIKTQKDIGYPLDNKYMTLLDYCLMLYETKHRQLKHLREQHSTLSGKILATSDIAPEPGDIHLNLRYTNLDHHQNYNLTGGDIGFDELVSYSMKYIDHAIAPEPLRESEKIDVRKLFKLFDQYEHPERFGEYNHPKRELALLSTSNSDITLPDIRSSLRDIKDSVKGEWTNLFVAKQDIDILDFLNHLKEYASLQQHFDVYRLATENVDINDLKNTIKQLLDNSGKIEAEITKLEQQRAYTLSTLPVEVQGVDVNTPVVTLTAATIEHAQANLEVAIAEIEKIVTLMREVSVAYPMIEYASIHDVRSGFIRIAVNYCIQQINLTKAAINNQTIGPLIDTVANLSKTDLEVLNSDIRSFSEKLATMGALKRAFVSVPDSVKKRFGITLTGDFIKFRDNLSPLLEVLPVIMNDTETVKVALKLDKKQHISLDKLKIVAPSDIKDVVSAIAPLNQLLELLQKYDIQSTNHSHTKQSIAELDRSLATLKTILSNAGNRGLTISSTIDKIVSAINISIEVAAQLRAKRDQDEILRNLWNEAYNASRSLIVGIDSTDDFKNKAPVLYEYLTHKSDQIPKLLETIAVPDHNTPVHADIATIETTLQAANNTDNFSDEFFEVRASSTVRGWLDNITILETYNNDLEILEYTRHNRSIAEIKRALGIANYTYVEDILSNDIPYSTFAARIVNAVVGEIFGRASMHHKNRISTTDMIRAYDRHLKSRRAATYRDTMRELYRQTQSATKELSKQSTLQAAGSSTMEKFRNNTSLIAEAFPIICATPKDVAKYLAPTKALFDYVIFDESSQLLPGQSLPAIYRAKKTVIIGDPHQMPPNLNASFSLTEQSEDDFDDLGESILDLVLKQPQKQHHLKVHYRSKYNKLFEPSQKAIYSSYGVEPIFEAELANGAPIDILDDLGDDVDEYGYDKNFAKVCEEAEVYLSHDENADFCILFTTSAKLQDFRNYLSDVGSQSFKKISSLYDNDKVLLSTVTNCQGIEGAYTLLYMHHYDRPGAMWFFKEQAGAYKRLNVSITRQRKGLKLLLADPRSHWIAACDQKLNSGVTGPNAALSANLMKLLLVGAGEQADVTYLDRELGDNINKFDSPLTEQLYGRLKKYYEDRLGKDFKIYNEVGWNLIIPRGEGIDANERNVGFRIDLGVYSLSKKKFVLGIEMDGAMYHSGHEKEHSDYTRQKVLEAKGWDIYRIWSTNWLLDTEKEFGRLTQRIDQVIADV